MPDENRTEATRPDAPSANESPFADAVEDAPVETAGEQAADKEPAQEPQAPDYGGEPKDGEDAAQDGQGSDDLKDETAPADELKVVVSIKGGRAVIGVQQPSSDPHIETFEDRDLPALAQEVTAVTERARAKWEEAPKHPVYARPAPPPKRRNRRQQGAAQDANAEGAAEQEQQTLRLF